MNSTTAYAADFSSGSAAETAVPAALHLAEQVAGRGRGAEGDVYFQQGARVKRGDLVLDVGANVGAFAAAVAARTEGDVTLHCFEPGPPVFEKLSGNFRKHDLLSRTRHKLHRVALTSPEHDGTERTFYFFKRLPTDSTLDIEFKKTEFRRFFEKKARGIEAALSGLGAPGKRLGVAIHGGISWLCAPDSKLGVWLAWKATGMQRVPCRLVSLERFLSESAIDHVDLLKVDVEGAEVDVLRGCGAAWPKIRSVAVETDRNSGRADRVEQILREQGFEIQSCVPHLAAARGDIAQVLMVANRPGN
ncbi:MAG: FkbM family methyltransferase [Polyangiaceae bacterium]